MLVGMKSMEHIRLFFIITLFFIPISTIAQFKGGFGYGDPNAWFDKEIFFSCQNNYKRAGQGQNFSNVTLVVKGVPYRLSGVWNYGCYISIGNDNGIEFSTGDKVELFINDKYIASWTCPKQPTMHLKMKGTWKLLKKGWTKMKKVKWWKYLKYIK